MILNSKHAQMRHPSTFHPASGSKPLSDVMVA